MIDMIDLRENKKIPELTHVLVGEPSGQAHASPGHALE
jgi:adenine specific DNA methylase Mod